MFVHSFRFGTAAILAVASSAATVHAYDFTPVAVSGRPNGDPLNPGFGEGIDYATVRPNWWSINSAGQVAFNHTVTGTNIVSGNDQAIWRWTNGTKELLAREGSQAPGAPAGVTLLTYLSGFALDLADDGSVLFNPAYQRAGSVVAGNDTALTIVAPNGVATTVVREGGALPGFPSSSFTTVDSNVGHTRNSSVLSPDGHILYQASFSGIGVDDDNDSALFYGMPGNVNLLVREGDTVSGAPGMLYANITAANNAASGDFVVFTGAVTPADQPSELGLPSIHLVSAGSAAPLAIVEQNAPGTTSTFTALNEPQVNATGKVTFAASLLTPSGGGSVALYTSTEQGLHPLMVGESAAPGLSSTHIFSSSINRSDIEHVLTPAGAVAFHHQVVDLGSSVVSDGIWINDGSETTLAVHEGDQAGEIEGATFNNLETFAFNEPGNLVFVSTLSGDVTTSNDQAMFLITSSGDLELILREGDLFDIDPTASVLNRTIASISLGGLNGSVHTNGEARLSTFNDSNQLTFALTFLEGGSGIYVSTIPEPTTAAIMMFIATGVLVRRR